MNWNFTKMHGSGNDFVVLDGVRQKLDVTPERARALADRHYGVGADQILLIERATVPNADFRYRIFNANGNEVEHCGNGARCFARFVHAQGLSDRNPLRAQISTGIIVADEVANQQITISMGSICFDPNALPFDTAGLTSHQIYQDKIWGLPLELPALDNPIIWISIVSISNPHAVQIVKDVDQAPVPIIGPKLESHARFKNHVNVGFMQIMDRHKIRFRVYERGAGETLSCGTGACAAAVVGIRHGLLDTPVAVSTQGGMISVSWDGKNLSMTGPAFSVFDGHIDVDMAAAAAAL